MGENDIRRVVSSGKQTALATVFSVIAGAATGWIADAPVAVLTVIALAAIVTVLVTPMVQVLPMLAGAVLAAAAGRIPALRVEDVFQGVAFGLVTALVLAGPVTIRRAVQRRRDFERRGWELAATQTRRRESETRAALQRERMTLAAEMHDGLGHSLTLIAVRLGQLSLAPSLMDEDRAEVASVRRLAAESAEELGLAVRLLRQSHEAGTGWTPPAVDDAIEGARAAGMRIEARIDSDVIGTLSDEAANAVARVIQEGLTNAAKHAPGQPVHILVAGDDDATVAVEVSNPRPADSDSRASEPGFGIQGLRHRAAMLGGELSVRETAGQFSVGLTLPRKARPVPETGPDPGDIAAAQGEAAGARSRATRLAVVLPLAVASTLAFVVTAHFVLATTLSVIGGDQFSEIAAGDDRAATERILPPMDMLEPPRDEFPARSGEECRYFEAEISFFERVEVYVVCFAGDRVSRTGTVAPS